MYEYKPSQCDGVVMIVLQVMGRFLILFVVLNQAEELHQHPVVYLLFLVYSLVELVRYISSGGFKGSWYHLQCYFWLYKLHSWVAWEETVYKLSTGSV